MKNRNLLIAAVFLFIAAVTLYQLVWAFPPTPPAPNSITGNAATATALASNPTDCGANTVATAIDASGNLTCSQSIGTIATQNSDNVTITGGNVTGLTNLEADNHTVTSTVNATGATWTGFTPKFTFVDGSSSANLTAIQLSGTVLGNPTQSGNVTHVLPAIEAGLQFDAILGLTAEFYFRLDPNANDSIYLDGVSCTDGNYIGLTTVTVGDAISCRAMKTGASTYDWACYTAKGAWACQ